MNDAYLGTAAAHLEQAAKNLNDIGAGATWAEKFDARLRLAGAYARLAAIERGMQPGPSSTGRTAP